LVEYLEITALRGGHLKISVTLVALALIIAISAPIIGEVYATDPGWNSSGKVTLNQTALTEPRIVYVPPGVGSNTEFMFFVSSTNSNCGSNSGYISLITSSNEFQTYSSVDTSPFCAQIQGAGNSESEQGTIDATFDSATNLIYLIFIQNGVAYVARVSPTTSGGTHFTDSSIYPTQLGLGGYLGPVTSPSITYDPVAGLLFAIADAPGDIGLVGWADSSDGINWSTDFEPVTASEAGTTQTLQVGSHYGASIRYTGPYSEISNGSNPPYVGTGVFIVYADSNGIVNLAHLCGLTSQGNYMCDGPHTDFGSGTQYSYDQPNEPSNPTQSGTDEPEMVWQGTNNQINLEEVNGPKTVLPEYTYSPPTLVFIANKNILLLGWLGRDDPAHLNVEPQNALTDGASFVGQTPPSSMCTGQTAQVAVTMQDTGSVYWAPPLADPNPFRLGAQNPQDNTIWGLNRVDIVADYVNTNPPGPGNDYTFGFQVTAPTMPGTYNFEWQMVQEGVNWFGAETPNVQVVVSNCNYVVSLSPASISIQQGSLYYESLSVSSINGFSGVVSLSASVPSGLSVYYFPSSLTVKPDSTNSTIFNIDSSSTTPTGSYSITATGTTTSPMGASASTVAITVTASSGGGGGGGGGCVITHRQPSASTSMDDSLSSMSLLLGLPLPGCVLACRC
jgi:hypothetical protein